MDDDPVADARHPDDDHQMVLIAAYRDLELAHEDFDEIERRIKSGMEMRLAALVTKNADGEPEVLEATNRHGTVGVGLGAGLGALFGLIAPPLGLSLIVGAAAGGAVVALAEHQLRSGLQNEVGEALKAGTAVILTVLYPHGRQAMEHTLLGADAFRELRMDDATVDDIEGTVTEVVDDVTTGTTDTSK